MTTEKPEKAQKQTTPAKRTLEIGLMLNNMYEAATQIKANARTELTQQDIEKKLQAHIKKNGFQPLQKSKPVPQQEHLQIQTKTTAKGEPQYKISGVEKLILAVLTSVGLLGAADIKISGKGEMTVTIKAEIGQTQPKAQKAPGKPGAKPKPAKTPQPKPIPMKTLEIKATPKRATRKAASKKSPKKKSSGGAAA